MEQQAHIPGIGGIYAILANISNRPRYAFLVLQLVSEIADGRGQAGPVVRVAGQGVLLRDWLCSQLLPLSEQAGRRAALRARVKQAISDQLTGDAARDAALVEQAVEDQVLAAGRANISRAISDLVRAGLMTRHYAGYATNHKNRGGRSPCRLRCEIGRPAVVASSGVPAWRIPAVGGAAGRPVFFDLKSKPPAFCRSDDF
ncbi:hypothetical protein ACFSTD_01715 [Novosphingobium colocasiae]